MENIKICLFMIQKNEEDVITKSSLPTVVPFIDAWTVEDTGSTDGSKELINEFFNKYSIPGKMLEHPWIHNFSYSRTKSMRNAEDYVRTIMKDGEIWYMFTIDADDMIFKGDVHDPHLVDEVIELDPDLAYDPRQEIVDSRYPDYILLNMHYQNMVYERPCFYRFYPNKEVVFNYDEISVHECLGKLSGKSFTQKTLKSGYYIGRTCGARSRDPAKYLRDANALQLDLFKAVKPALRSRILFYLAQSYSCIQWYKQTIVYLKEYLKMPAFHPAERYVAMVRLAKSYIMKRDPKVKKFIFYLNEAISFFPEKHEAYYHLINHYYKLEEYQRVYRMSHDFLRMGRNYGLFARQDLKSIEVPDMLSIACYNLGHYKESITISNMLIALGRDPDRMRENIKECELKMN